MSVVSLVFSVDLCVYFLSWRRRYVLRCKNKNACLRVSRLRLLLSIFIVPWIQAQFPTTLYDSTLRNFLYSYFYIAQVKINNILYLDRVCCLIITLFLGNQELNYWISELNAFLGRSKNCIWCYHMNKSIKKIKAVFIFKTFVVSPNYLFCL